MLVRSGVDENKYEVDRVSDLDVDDLVASAESSWIAFF